MAVTVEEKTLLWDLYGFDGEEGVFPILDEACKNWLLYRQAQEDLDAVDALELSVRSANILHNAGVRSIAQLRKMSEEDLIKIGCATKKVRRDIAEALAEWDAKHPVKTAMAEW